MTLDDAWDWYVAIRTNLRRFGRFAEKHWDALPWDGPIGRDDHFRELESNKIGDSCAFGLSHLDDLAVLILFSVFESIVRDRVVSMVREEQDRLSLDLLRRIVDGAVEDIEQGSFARVLDVFKARDADLVEEVHQVRRYRNWVAHGRSDRVTRPEFVDPEMAYQRLRRFLEVLSLPFDASTDPGP